MTSSATSSGPRFRYPSPTVGAVLAVAALLGVAGCGGPASHEPAAEAARPAALALETAVVVEREVAGRTEVHATVAPRRRVSPGSKLLGRVEEVRVREGQRVRRGQVLARLESRDLHAAVEQAAAGVDRAEAELERARLQHRRMTELHGRGSATPKALEDAAAAARIAGAVRTQAAADLTAARVMLDYAEVRAPVDGWITARHVEAGDMATPGAPLVTIDDLSGVEVVAVVPESAIAALRDAERLEVRVDAAGLRVEAPVYRIVPAADPASRTYEVRLSLPNDAGRLTSGMFARVALPAASRRMLTVGVRSLVRHGQLDGVYVVDIGGLARLRWIRPGRVLDGEVEVLSGLAPGERIVVAPPPELTDGTPVRDGPPAGTAP